MTDKLIELGLRNGQDASQAAETPIAESRNLNARLLAVISNTTIESETLKTAEFRAKLETYRKRLEQSADEDPSTFELANDCLRLCQDYLGRARVYLLDREREITDVIEIMLVALRKLAGDGKAFNVRLRSSSERIHRLTEIEDIRELKRRINQEVRDLDQIVTEKQIEDELQHAKLAKHIEVLKANLTQSNQAALIDTVTRIANRAAFDQVFERWVASHVEIQKSFVVAIFEIDDFKYINETHGHQVGDRVLFCVAEWLTKCVSQHDFLARYGGAEFVVMFADLGLTEAEGMLSALLANMANCNYAYKRGDQDCTVSFTASCGLAEFTLNESGEDLFRRADEALLVAKRTGKNRVAHARTERSLWKSLTSRGLSRTLKQKS
jgi:diguanylate cyclase (GGDEF)-like protein